MNLIGCASRLITKRWLWKGSVVRSILVVLCFEYMDGDLRRGRSLAQIRRIFHHCMLSKKNLDCGHNAL